MLLFAEQSKKIPHLNHSENQLPWFVYQLVMEEQFFFFLLQTGELVEPKATSMCPDDYANLCSSSFYLVFFFFLNFVFPDSGPEFSCLSPVFERSLFPSQSQALAHYKGTKHAKKLKALDTPKSKLKGSVVTKDTASQETTKGMAATAPVPNGGDRKGLCRSTNTRSVAAVAAVVAVVAAAAAVAGKPSAADAMWTRWLATSHQVTPERAEQ